MLQSVTWCVFRSEKEERGKRRRKRAAVDVLERRAVIPIRLRLPGEVVARAADAHHPPEVQSEVRWMEDRGKGIGLEVPVLLEDAEVCGVHWNIMY
jgi:hypothetical protein